MDDKASYQLIRTVQHRTDEVIEQELAPILDYYNPGDKITLKLIINIIVDYNSDGSTDITVTPVEGEVCQN